jgi:hypothetical protein
LKPDDWTKQVTLGWRWAADELQRSREREEQALPSALEKPKRRRREQ